MKSFKTACLFKRRAESQIIASGQSAGQRPGVVFSLICCLVETERERERETDRQTDRYLIAKKPTTTNIANEYYGGLPD